MASDMQLGGGWLRGLLGGQQSAEASNGTPGTTTLAELKAHGVITPVGPHAHPIPVADKTGSIEAAPNLENPAHGGTDARWLFALNQTLPTNPAKIKRFRVDPVTKSVTLPDGTVLDSPQLSGKDLLLFQKDGTVIIIENAILVDTGVASLPTLIIGGSVLPGGTLTIVLGLTDEQVAAAAESEVGSGGDLAVPPGNIGPGLDYGPLLPFTELFFPTLTREEIREALLEEEGSLVDIKPSLTGTFGPVLVREPHLDLNQNPPASPGDLGPGYTTGTIGENEDNREETAEITGVTFTAGSEAIDLTFADPNVSGNEIQVLNEAGQPIADAAGVPVVITWVLSPDGIHLEGFLPGAETPAIILEIVNTKTGEHDTHADPGQSITPVITITLTDAWPHLYGDPSALNITINGIKIVATDTSGDEVFAPLVVQIVDDAPLNNDETINTTVYEDALSNFDPGDTSPADGIEGSAGNNEGGKTTDAVFTAAQIASLVNVGADMPPTITLNQAIDGTSTGVTSKSSLVSFEIVDSTHINGVASDGRIVFTLLDDGAGTFTFTLVDQVDHLTALGDDDASVTIDLAQAFIATDNDGDSVVLDTGLTVAIENDVPLPAAGQTASITVHEDALGRSSPAITNLANNADPDLSLGNVDNVNQTDSETFTNAALQALVLDGADEEVTFKLNLSATGAVVDTAGVAVTSKGLAVTYQVSMGVVQGVASDGRIVFTLTQTAGAATADDPSDDVFTFNLNDQIDHTPGVAGTDTEIRTLNLTGAFTAADFDADPVTLAANAIQVAVQNDVPLPADGRTASITVHEDALGRSSPAITNLANNADPDLSLGNVDNVNQTDSETFTNAALQALVLDGADEEVTFKLNLSATGAVVDTAGVAVTSKGLAVTYQVSMGVVQGVASDGRIVFTLTQTAGAATADDPSDDVFTFNLNDQIDHTPGVAGTDTEIRTLNLTGAFTAADFDADPVTLAANAIQVAVQNDVPLPADGRTASITVHEDALGRSSPAITNLANNADPDLSLGNVDNVNQTDSETFTNAALQALVLDGADEEVTFKLNLSATGAVVDTAGVAVTSKGLAVTYQVSMGVVQGVASDGRIVFTLTQTAGAATADDPSDDVFTFNLNDQIDHTPGVAGTDTEIRTLNLTGAFTAADFDADPVTLAANAIQVAVQNDVPLPADGRTASITVHEDALGRSSPAITNLANNADPDLSLGNVDNVNQTDSETFTNAALQALVLDGADEEVTFKLNLSATGAVVDTAGVAVTSKGLAVTYQVSMGVVQGVASDGRIVFTLTQTAGAATADDPSDDVFTFNLNDQIDHTPGVAGTDTEIRTLNLTGAFTAADFDADPVTLAANAIQVAVQNDVPLPAAGQTASITVHEDALGRSSPAITNLANNADPDLSLGNVDNVNQTDSETFTNAALQALVLDGADEEVTFKLNLSATGAVVDTAGVAVTSKGLAVTYQVSMGVVQGVASDGRIVFTLTQTAGAATADDPSDDVFTFNLNDQIDHTPGVAGTDTEIRTLNLTGAFTAADFDADPVTLAANAIQVAVQNDVPLPADGRTASITVHEDALGRSSPAITNLANNADPDLSLGNVDNVNQTDSETFTNAALQALVLDGADEEVTFKLNLSATGAVVDTAGVAVTSKGLAVTYQVSMGVVQGVASDGRIVFTLTQTAGAATADDPSDDVFTFNLNDQIDHTPGVAGTDTEIRTLNLTGAFTAADFDADPVTLAANAIQVAVQNDVPLPADGRTASITVHEDALGRSSPAITNLANNADPDLSLGNVDNVNQTDSETFTNAALQALVLDGADEEVTFKLNLSATGAVVDTAGVAVTSKGLAVTYQVSMGVVQGVASDGRIVFTLTQTAGAATADDPSDDVFTFNLNDQIDHTPGVAGTDTEIRTLNLTGAFTAADFDADPVTLAANAIQVAVQNDVPLPAAGQTASITVHEDALGRSSPAITNLANNADPDLSLGNVDNVNQTDSETFTNAALQALVLDGADEEVTFKLNLSATGAVVDTAGVAVTSKGLAVTYQVSMGVVQGVASDGRIVFTLTQTAGAATADDPSDDVFTFNLNDQIDHTPGVAGTDTEIRTLNLTGAFTAADFDADPVTLAANAIQVAVQNDVPLPADGRTASITVHEDALGRSSPAITNLANNADPDLSLGNVDNVNQTDSETFTNAALQALVLDGADEEVTFKLNLSATGAVVDTAGVAVTSKGLAVTYQVSMGVVQGVASDGRIVFTLTQTAGAATADDPSDDVFTFNLNDQIDHTPGVAGTDTEIRTLNLTGAFTAADFDADPVTLAANAIQVAVQNDVPLPAAGQTASITVHEDALGRSSPAITNLANNADPDLSLGNVDNVNQTDSETFTNAALQALVLDGADEEVTFKLNLSATGAVVDTAGVAVTSKGLAVTYQVSMGVVQGVASDGRIVFTLTQTAGAATADDPSDDVFTFNLNDQIDHTPGVAGTDTEIRTLNLTGAFTAADFDADPVTLAANAIQVAVQNDVPLPADGRTASITVHEDALGRSSPAITNLANNADPDLSLGNVDNVNQTDSETFTNAALQALVLDGADEEVTFKLNLSATGAVVDTAGVAVTSKGLAVTYQVSMGVVQGVASDGRIVFTLTQTAGAATADDPSDDVFTFNLNDQIDHTPGVAGTDTEIRTLNLTGAFTAADFDADPVTLAANAIQVAVQNDVPLPADGRTASITVHEDALGRSSPAITNLANNADPDLSLGNVDNVNQTDSETFTNAALQALVLDGADEEVTFKLNLSATGAVVDTAGVAVTSKGLAVTYQVSMGVVQGVASDGRIVFTLTQTAGAATADDPSDDVFTFNLNDQIDHTPGVAGTDTEIRTLNLTGAFTAADFDADPVTLAANAIQVAVQNDVPVEIDPASVVLDNADDAMATGALDVDSNIDDNIGADEPASIKFANITEGADSGLTSGGTAIRYYLSVDGKTLTASTATTEDGVTPGNTIFTITLNHDTTDATPDTYKVTMFGTVDNGSGVTFNDLSGGDAGNPTFKIIQTTSSDLLELLFTPINENSINSDVNDVGVGSQFIGIVNGDNPPADKGLRIDFGDFTFHANAGGGSDDGFTINSHTSVNGFRFTIDQISQGTIADVQIKAYDANDGVPNQSSIPGGTAPGGVHDFTNDTLLTITQIEIFDNTGTSIGTFSANGSIVLPGEDIFVTFLGTSGVTITGLRDDYSVLTRTASGYDRIEITNIGTTGAGDDGKFSLSNLQLETVQTGAPINLTFDLALTDFDGDTVVMSDALNVTLVPPNPTATVDIADTLLSNTDTFSLVTIQFSEAVTGFDTVSDLAAVGGMLSDFTMFDVDTYQVTFTANSGFEGTGLVTLTGAYADLFANAGITGASDTVAIDRINPTAVGETILVNNDSVDIPEWVLVLNETTGAVDVTVVVQNTTGGDSADHDPGGVGTGFVTFDDGGTNGGDFTYQVVDAAGNTSTIAAMATITPDTAGAINGTAGNDLFFGYTGDDTLSGALGNDTYAFSATGDGNDTIVDTSGTDTIVIGMRGGAISGLNFLNLPVGPSDDLVIQYNGLQITVLDHFDGTTDVESISFDGGSFGGYSLGTGSYLISQDNSGTRTGTAGNDLLADNNAAPGGNTLSGLAGNDLLFGNGGIDTLLGGDGDDLLVGGAGNDTLTGGAGTDTFKLTDLTIADLISDFGDGADMVDLTALFDDPTPAGVSDYVFYDATTGKLYVDAAGAGADNTDSHVATVTASGGGFPAAGTITIVFDDGAAQHTTTV